MLFRSGRRAEQPLHERFGLAHRKALRDVARLEEELSERLGTTVEIRQARKGGKLVVHYSSVEHLEQLLKRLK